MSDDFFPQDILDMAAEVLADAKEKGVMIATAESCTGGLIFGALTAVAGSSAVAERAFVTYSNHAKIQVLGVAKDTIREFGAVSDQTAAEMAAGALENSHARLAVAVTGVAGPGASGPKPEGMVSFAIADASGVKAHTMQFGPLGRGAVRAATVRHALTLLGDALT